MAMNKIKWRIVEILSNYPLSFKQEFSNLLLSFSKKDEKTKIFCIGNPKTATTSLANALEIIGYKTVRLPFYTTWKKKSKEEFIEKLQKSNYNAFIDFPVGFEDLYKKIHKMVPDAKFILTVRDKEKFRKSYVNHFKRSSWEIKDPEELDKKIDFLDKRNKDVIEFFKDKPSKLFVIDITKGEGWEKLCKFLNRPIPKLPFPHKNKGKYKKKDWKNIY